MTNEDLFKKFYFIYTFYQAKKKRNTGNPKFDDLENSSKSNANYTKDNDDNPIIEVRNLKKEFDVGSFCKEVIVHDRIF